MPTCESQFGIINSEKIPTLKGVLEYLIETCVGKEIDTPTLSRITGINSRTLSSWAERGLIPFCKISNGGATFGKRFSPSAAIKAICVALLIEKKGNRGKVTWAVAKDDLTGNDWFNCETAPSVTETILANLLSSSKQSD